MIANKLEEECSATMCVSWQEYQLITNELMSLAKVQYQIITMA